MNTAATIMASCAAVYLLIGGAYLRLSAIRRLGREYGFFSALALGLGVASIGGTWLALAGDAAESDRALRLEHAGILIALGAFANFTYANVQRPTGRPGQLTTGLAIVGLVLCLGGWIFDPGRAVSPELALGPMAYPQAGMTRSGIAISAVALLASAWVTADVAALGRNTRSGRYVLLAIFVGLAAWMGMLAVRISGRSVGPWFELVLTPFFTMVAARLVQRWVDADALLEKRSAQLESAMDELRRAQTELVKREQLAAVGELSAVIAHEVRNPLAVLKNAVAGLRRDNLTPDLRETLHGILDQETDRLNRLVRDLLSYAKPVNPAHVEVDLRGLIERALDQARRAVGPNAAGIDIQQEIAVPETIKADPDLLERALVHVMENAFEAMPNGGTLSVLARETVEDGGRRVSISIVDSGEGMDTLVRSRAREPFFTTRQQGTGLGLAIVERVAATHGGRLELAREAEGGTRVTLVVPVIETGPRSDPPRRVPLIG